MAATAFGLGTPIGTSAPMSPWGLSPYSGVTTNPLMFMGSPFPLQTQLPLPSQAGFSPHASLPLQQVLQLAQAIPQQLQQLLQLSYLQQHQLQQLQQVLQFIPAQLQQLIPFAPQQYLQQIQHPFGTGGLPANTPWGISPQIAGGQPGYVM